MTENPRRSLAERLEDHDIELPETITDRWLERGAKPAPFGAYNVYDDRATGLGLTVSPSGRKTWFLQTVYPGQASQARRRIGQYPAMSLKDARAKAAEWLKQVKAGDDPADVAREEAEKAQKERLAKALRNQATFGAFAEKYIAGRTNRRAAVDAQEIRRMLIAEWGTRPIHDILARDVRELTAKLLARGPYDARNGFGHAVSIFKQAVAEDLIAVSPCASIDKKALFRGKIKPRQRTLKPEELAAFWRGAGRLGTPYEAFFKLLALTGLRLNELARARWVELDPALRKALRDASQAKTPINWQALPDEIKVLRVPAQRFKSDREHVVQLSGAALDIIASLPRGEYLFSTDGRKPINGLSKTKQRLDGFMLEHLRQLAEERGEDARQVTLPPWVAHDTRRTLRTGLAALGVRFEVAETVLGHTLGGLAAVYNVHGYAAEQREALEKWAEKLRSIVEPQRPAPTTGDNVVTLPKRKRA